MALPGVNKRIFPHFWSQSGSPDWGVAFMLLLREGFWRRKVVFGSSFIIREGQRPTHTWSYFGLKRALLNTSLTPWRRCSQLHTCIWMGYEHVYVHAWLMLSVVMYIIFRTVALHLYWQSVLKWARNLIAPTSMVEHGRLPSYPWVEEQKKQLRFNQMTPPPFLFLVHVFCHCQFQPLCFILPWVLPVHNANCPSSVLPPK